MRISWAVVAALGACAFDWDAYDPRLATNGTSATSAIGGMHEGGSGASAPGNGGSAGSGGMEPPPTGTHLCSRGFAEPSGFEWGRAVAPDASLNIFVTGFFQGTLDLGGNAIVGPPADNNVFVARFDPSCNHVWSMMIGGDGKEEGRDIAVDAQGDVYVTGGFDGELVAGGMPFQSLGLGDVYLVKIANGGQVAWTQQWGTLANENAEEIALDAGGNIFLVGGFETSIDFGAGALQGSNDLYVVKLDPAANAVWSVALSAGGYAIGKLALSGTSPIVAGQYVGSLDLGSQTLMATGTAADAYVLKLTPAGAVDWGVSFGSTEGTAGDYVRRVATSASGDIVVVGRFDGTLSVGGENHTCAGDRDMFVVKLDTAGNILWSRAFGSAGTDDIMAVSVDGHGHIVIAGGMDGAIDFGGGAIGGVGSVFIAKLDAAGQHLWSHAYAGGSSANRGIRSDVDAAGNVLVTGRLGDSIDFGGGPVVPGTSTDAFFVKLSP